MRRLPGPSFWDEFSELMESQFGEIVDRRLPALRGDIRIDVTEHDDEVIVVADLPGVEKENISASLVDPSTIEITCERKSEHEEEKEGYYMRERSYGSMSRLIRLPAEVIGDNAKTSFTNGVLEIRLKKSAPDEKTVIKIN